MAENVYDLIRNPQKELAEKYKSSPEYLARLKYEKRLERLRDAKIAMAAGINRANRQEVAGISDTGGGGGHGQSNLYQLGQEAIEQEKEIREGYDLEQLSIKKAREDAKEAARKQRLNSWLGPVGQIGGAVLGGVLAIPTGGLSIGAGAALGSAIGGNVGQVAKTLATGEAPNLGFSFLADLERFKGTQSTPKELTPEMESSVWGGEYSGYNKMPWKKKLTPPEF